MGFDACAKLGGADFSFFSSKHRTIVSGAASVSSNSTMTNCSPCTV